MWQLPSIATINNVIILIVAFLFIRILFSKRIRQSRLWHATVTPLASIIGSGFLVSAPLLMLVAGKYAVLIMLLIVTIAYFLGSSIRLNILYSEPSHDNPNTSPWLIRARWLSGPVLGIAYVISVAFYLKLLSAFLLEAIGYKTPFYVNMVTTALMLLIALVGKFRGLSRLELFEICCVNTKLAIIFAMMLGFAIYDSQLVLNQGLEIFHRPHESLWIGIRKVLGLVIIVQGFETSRYLGVEYDPTTRVRSMKLAQIISSIIYVLFILLAMPVIGNVDRVQETLIITISAKVAMSLPILILIAAMMSQFSAAIADTIGGAGLLIEEFFKKLSINNAYVITLFFSCVLTWVTNIFEVIAIASRAFALYYFIEIFISLITIWQVKEIKHKVIKSVCYFGLLILMGMVVLFGISAE
ncbi:MAG: hypothetical protein AB7V32_01065 [Candidatus Berkiella sp.]